MRGGPPLVPPLGMCVCLGGIAAIISGLNLLVKLGLFASLTGCDVHPAPHPPCSSGKGSGAGQKSHPFHKGASGSDVQRYALLDARSLERVGMVRVPYHAPVSCNN